MKLPTGYSLVWSGQYENMLRVRERLKLVLPVTILLIFLLLYMNTKSAFKAPVVAGASMKRGPLTVAGWTALRRSASTVRFFNDRGKDWRSRPDSNGRPAV